ncbi:ABC transporter ATP-binding protein [Streptomyces sp. SAJ15]|uniref:ABC transporter ATP-binding protein n=1 Tax=Streptomyces sp. SAJ15 TaxID=2011095 RepID=UPI001184801F|nr:ABC transporter ATP-binding protein [Streptomyces sp. SAJ15]TVL91487.1 lipoprotein-releasing system ATP-binding protein LolD [Streptomyces sp. SAJ15]
MAENRVVLRAEKVRREFVSGDSAVEVLKGCSLEVSAGEFVAIVGRSGSGKSTLANVLSGLDRPTSGTVTLLGRDLSRLGEAEAAAMRAREIGFVLQKDNLIPSFTIEENVAAPLVMGGTKLSDALQQAREMLSEVGLSHRAKQWPGQVSGGEAQRAAVARACVVQPAIVFADEPTGALDEENGRQVQEIFHKLVSTTGAAGLIITHDRDLAAGADTVITLADGQVVATERTA